MSKNSCCWPPGDRARERRSSGGGHGCSWCRELAHTARGCLPAPRVSVQGVLGRRGLALCWSAHASSLDVPPRHSSQRWLGLDDAEQSRVARSVARMLCARSCARLCGEVAHNAPSQCSCRMSISSVGCTEVSEARSCELLSPRRARRASRMMRGVVGEAWGAMSTARERARRRPNSPLVLSRKRVYDTLK